MPHYSVSFPVVALLNLQVEADDEDQAVEDAATLVTHTGAMSISALETAVGAIAVDGFTVTLDCDIATDEAVVSDIFDLD